MTTVSLGSSFRIAAVVAMLSVACGRTGLDGLPTDETGGATGGLGGTGADGGMGGAGAAVTGGSSLGGTSAGGTSAGGTSAGGTSAGGTNTGGSCVGTGPDFDFTIASDQAVAYQIDPAHSGAQLARRIEPPLRELWRVDFDQPVSYPIVADSRVFVSSTLTDRLASIVYAFDAATGENIWQSEPIEGDLGSSDIHLAYDRGALFAQNEMGTVVAFEPARGDVRWQKQYDRVRGDQTVPIAAGGAVFILGPRTEEFPNLYALDACDGTEIYTGAKGFGFPTLGDDLIYSSSVCHETKALDARTGNIVWEYSEGCFGSAGEFSAFHGGRLYVGDSNDGVVALDASTGVVWTTLDAEFPAWLVSTAGDDVLGQGYAAGTYVLNAFEPTDGSIRWSVAYPGNPTLPLLLTPGYAWALLEDASVNRYLVAIDLASHALAWQSPEPTVPSTSDWPDNGLGPVQTIAAGGGRIVVAKRGTLVAYAHDDRATCGNRILEDGEACDDGNTDDGDHCSDDCTRVTGECGDGVIQSNESCDGSPTPAGASCSDECQLTFEGVMLAAGFNHTCGLRQDGTVICWGASEFSSELPPGNYTYIAAWESYASGLRLDGFPVFWGRYESGESTSGPFTKVETGIDAFCGLRPNNIVDCFGLTFASLDRKFADLSVADDEVCGLTQRGELYCYFAGASAQWPGTFRAVNVAQSGDICAIKENRTLLCRNNLAPPPGEFIAVSGGHGFWCGIRAGGTLTCWGNLNASGNASLEPPPGKFAVIDAGWQHACAVRIDGLTLCWGANEAGQATPPEDFP